ncbi:PREDICTED: uncharacterized protein LOC104823047 isoform X2 [Tarenaya hassleriana]|uniref:uncharacterized protein LOC104823047 isoform X2 n=1 Tax=Tarenaya hassleriana TaxID=28532 RepID=UPI00053C90FC|nr:PREDICTED: uncharacterized protein LOC104823047 isoform X2 [Tarenaya hassleriana]
MSCDGDVTLCLEDGMHLLPSDVLKEAFLCCIYPKEDDRDPRTVHAPYKYRPDVKPAEHGGRPFLSEQPKQKPRAGTGVFLPQRLVSQKNKRTDMKSSWRRGNADNRVWEEKRKVQTSTESQCAVTSCPRQVFLPKEWTY